MSYPYQNGSGYGQQRRGFHRDAGAYNNNSTPVNAGQGSGFRHPTAGLYSHPHPNQQYHQPPQGSQLDLADPIVISLQATIRRLEAESEETKKKLESVESNALQQSRRLEVVERELEERKKKGMEVEEELEVARERIKGLEATTTLQQPPVTSEVLERMGLEQETPPPTAVLASEVVSAPTPVVIATTTTTTWTNPLANEYNGWPYWLWALLVVLFGSLLAGLYALVVYLFGPAVPSLSLGPWCENLQLAKHIFEYRFCPLVDAPTPLFELVSPDAYTRLAAVVAPVCMDHICTGPDVEYVEPAVSCGYDLLCQLAKYERFFIGFQMNYQMS